ncbi:DUF1365 domain-containing protein [Pilimelia terevasa]|uniref:DUF1365 domain-containing protein n=1 Tax=Pilimelia terevasa TaxID=53372 RepID=A0A8J3BVS1_9ACTN|nr:DUF1365 domain-containing protein [Pilimelia terevasa]GGK42701.1 DUF1365 domain-containing protein [Pilimelia terevasa]
MTAAADLPALPALVVGHVRHLRVRPVRHGFRYRHWHWLVDLDDPPRVPWALRPLARFAQRDHLCGGAAGGGRAAGRDGGLGGIKADVVRLLAAHGVAADDRWRVLMLAHARQWGYVFNPLTVYWCLDPRGRLGAAVLEVHNTYGQRHAYVLRPDGDGAAGMDKEFYVSPFNDVSGRYQVRLTLSPAVVGVAVDLYRDDALVLAATVHGVPRPATGRALLGRLAVMPAATLRVTALIHWHGVRLWRRLPVQPRPARNHPEVAP